MEDSTPKAPLAIHHLALRVSDCEASRVFYGDILGLAELRRSVREGVVESIWLGLDGGAILMLERRLRGAGPETGSGHALAFGVDDLAAWETRLAAAGLSVEDRTAHTIYVRDPDGHRVGLTIFPETNGGRPSRSGGLRPFAGGSGGKPPDTDGGQLLVLRASRVQCPALARRLQISSLGHC